MLYDFWIPGKPFGKQRPRVTRTGQAYTPKETVSYENLVRTSFVQAYPNYSLIEGPVILMVSAAFPIPESWPKKKKEAARNLEIFPGKPDIDNIMKIIQDALNQIAYKDDSQIYDATVRKYYSDTPCVHVLITGGTPIHRASM